MLRNGRVLEAAGRAYHWPAHGKFAWADSLEEGLGRAAASARYFVVNRPGLSLLLALGMGIALGTWIKRK
jgi:hypothetical protein